LPKGLSNITLLPWGIWGVWRVSRAHVAENEQTIDWGDEGKWGSHLR